jgi:hypothetical protein
MNHKQHIDGFSLSSRSPPILIDEDHTPITTLSRLPAFDRNDTLTKLLYSKFIVKGVRPINEQAIMSKFIKKGGSQKHQRKTTQDTANCTKEAIVREHL